MIPPPEILLAAVVVMMVVAAWRARVTLRAVRDAERDIHHREDLP